MMNNALSSINRDEFLARVENDEELARELLVIFQSDAPVCREKLRLAVQTRSADKVRRVAHTLKGMLANLSAISASARAAELEQLAKSARIEEFSPAWAALQQELDLVLRDVEHFLAGVLK